MTSECHGCMGCAWISSHTQTLQMWDSIRWLDHQKLSRYSNRLLPGIIPKEEEEKSNKVFISGSQMKRISCECHKVLQEHNCFWALICFSAATTGGKGVNIVVKVSVHNLFCTPCDGPAWNHGRWYTGEKVLRADLQYFIMENSLPQLTRALIDTHLGSAFSAGVKSFRQSAFPLCNTPLISKSLNTSEKFGLQNTTVLWQGKISSSVSYLLFCLLNTIATMSTLSFLFAFPSLMTDHLVFMRRTLWETSFKRCANNWPKYF